jgi:probable F420-dependent oxidoreductase
MTRRFRFGVQLSQAGSRKEWLEQVRKAEDLGYSTIFMPDHFGNQLAPVPALMAAAENSNLRIGALVWDNDYRHPVVFAKELATLDLLTEGRLEVGLGAGWMRSDYEQSGIDYDPPKVRVDRFEEGLTVIKGLLAGDHVKHEGTHYKVDHRTVPTGVQKPPPILVGGGGRRVLGIAGREADIVSVNFNLRGGEVSAELGRDAVVEAIDNKIEWVKAGAGDRFDDIELSATVFMATVTDDRQGWPRPRPPCSD